MMTSVMICVLLVGLLPVTLQKERRRLGGGMEGGGGGGGEGKDQDTRREALCPSGQSTPGVWDPLWSPMRVFQCSSVDTQLP